MMNHLILASPTKERIASWKLALDGFVCTTSIIITLDMLNDDVERIKPKVLLLDFDLLDLDSSIGATSLKKLSAETKIIIMSNAISEDVEWKMFKLGVRGSCQNNCEPELLTQVVIAVQQGELWIRRTIASRLIDDFGSKSSKNKAYQASLHLLDRLTQREYDIAMCAGKGVSNKHIAKACGITERTVKAHLSEIYNKLGITDRIHLALILATDERNTRRTSSVKDGSKDLLESSEIRNEAV
jgi:DNA-binding NarL/FixJ family response regulator